MYNCASDWSFDLFLADCKKYKALPIKGVYCRQGASDNEVFISTIKLICNEWLADHTEDYTVRGINSNGREYCYVETRDLCKALWAYLRNDVYFSDWYKDTYNQRPHLNGDLYLYALGYTELIDRLTWLGLSFRTMNDIIEDYAKSAQRSREYLEGLHF